jgi:hypothetical protein
VSIVKHFLGMQNSEFLKKIEGQGCEVGGVVDDSGAFAAMSFIFSKKC